jgi:chemotaxis protein CheY-P-specific phosphatase CheC
MQAMAGGLEAARGLVGEAADWAAGALEQLAGCRLPVRECRVTRADGPAQPGPWEVGLFVELHGGVGGLVGLLLTGDTRDALVKALLGTGTRPEPADAAESALRELGNIVASQAISALAAGLGQRLLPSVPTLVARAAESALVAAIRRRTVGPGSLRFECLLRDPRTGLRALLVVAPDAPFWQSSALRAPSG